VDLGRRVAFGGVLFVLPLACQYFLGVPDSGVCLWVEDVKEIAAAFLVFTTEQFRKVLSEFRPVGNGCAASCEMEEVPVLEAWVGDYQVQVVVCGGLDSIFEVGVFVDIDYTEDFIVGIAYCAGCCVFLLFCESDNAHRIAAALLPADFYVDRGKAQFFVEFHEVVTGRLAVLANNQN